MLSGTHQGLAAAADAARRASKYLLSLRRPDGHWHFGAAGGAALDAGLILLESWQGGTAGTRIASVTASLLAKQLPDGGFAARAGGPADLDATVMAYAALKIAGTPSASPVMAAARACAVGLGGIGRCSPRLKLELSLLGLYTGEGALQLAPEIALAPGLLDEMGRRKRTLMIPLAILGASEPRRAAEGLSIEELEAGHEARAAEDPYAGLRFAAVLRFLGRHAVGPLRSRAIRECARLMAGNLTQVDASGDAFTAVRYALMACDALGYETNHPVRKAAGKQLARLIHEDHGWLHIQPCTTEIQDTALAISALAEVGTGADQLRPALAWLAAHSDTADPDTEALLVLAGAGSDAGAQRLLRMQARGGGWPANESCPDTTGLALQALNEAGTQPPARAATELGVGFLRSAQQLDGSWRGGAGYIRATFRALRGLAAAGVDDRDAAVLRGGEWLRSVQNADGGWGEDATGADSGFASAQSTVVHTAWAVAGLIAGGDTDSISVQNGIASLAARQRPDGTWDEAGGPVSCGEDGVVYASYSLIYPLLALGAYGRTGRIDS